MQSAGFNRFQNILEIETRMEGNQLTLKQLYSKYGMEYEDGYEQQAEEAIKESLNPAVNKGKNCFNITDINVQAPGRNFTHWRDHKTNATPEMRELAHHNSSKQQ